MPMPQASAQHCSAERPAQVADRGRFRALLRGGDWRGARAEASKGVALADDRDERLRWMADQAQAEWAGGHPDIALQTLDGAARLYDETESAFHQAVYETSRGMALEGQEMFDEALCWYAGGLAHFEAVGCREGVACLRNNVGVVLTKIGRPDEAESYLLSALADYRALGDEENAREVCRSLAEMFARLGSAAAA